MKIWPHGIITLCGIGSIVNSDMLILKFLEIIISKIE